MTANLELQNLRAELAELSRLASENSAASVAVESTHDRRAKIADAIRDLGRQEQAELRAWLDSGRSGSRPASRDAERAQLHAQLCELRDDDILHAANAEVAQKFAEDISRRVVEIVHEIERRLHVAVEEHVAAAIAEHAEALEAVSHSLAKLGGLQRALLDLSRKHGDTGRQDLERAVLILADGLNDQKHVSMREEPETARAAQEHFRDFLARIHE